MQPTNVVELGAANNLMRLQGDTIQPVDKYILHRDNPELWLEEMKEYRMTDEEIDIIKEHIEDSAGVSDSQEQIMLLSMDERISNFSVLEANELRKAVARIDAEVLSKVKENFYKKGKEKGNSESILNYVWDKQIIPQSGYGFSELHSSAYSLIALQNMNLSYKYPQVYWNTACLSVNSGADEDNQSSKGGDYGRVAASIGNMQARGIKIELPSINHAGYGFTPNPENNSIVFGLKGIVGVGDHVVEAIIANRPYSSFNDFLVRLYDSKLAQNQHMLQLIKAGCFDEFGERPVIMKEYINHTFTPRDSLTLASFNVIINLGIVPEELDLSVRFYRFRQYIYQNPVGRSDERKTKNRLFKLDGISTEFLYEHFTNDCIVEYCDTTGSPIIGEWLFDREYEKKMQVVREWLAKEETVELVNKTEFDNAYNNATSGNISSDEMDSLCYYYSGHELSHVDRDKYGVANFSELSSEPEAVREYMYRKQMRYEYKLHRVVGTVLDKDKNRHTVTILTPDGVVTVKLYRSNYSYYDRQISETGSNGKKTVIERSWFTRGNLIMFTGFRRGNQFVPRVYRNSIYQNSVALINSIDEEGNLSLTTERAEIN